MNPSPLQHTLSRLLMLLSAFLFGLVGFFWKTGIPEPFMFVGGALMGAVVFVGLKLILPLVFQLFSFVPKAFLWVILAFFGAAWLAKMAGLRLPEQVYYSAVLLLFGVAFSVTWFGLRLKNKFTLLSFAGLVLPLVFLAGGLYWLFQEGKDPFRSDLQDPVLTALEFNPLKDALDPAAEGAFAIDSFTYGSGSDKQRVEFAQQVRFETPSLDASLILPDWKGKKKKWREKYWDFGVKNFPLNGRAYVPVGEGPFPIALIVHGNHGMIDYSDDGYGYLCRMLASQGIIAVSVDENFLNGHWSGDFQGKEMPARAWLLLKHLDLWRTWSKSIDHPLYGKADLEKVMLVGHSRGGEAVAIAAVFNRLPVFPDNANLAFDFNFGIQSVVAIAPTDYRYQRQMNMEDVNYLTIQGSYDSDETSFWGMRAYQRLQFSDSTHYIKAGVYIHKANHGQFNSTWGRKDFGPPYGWLLNTAPMLTASEQQQAARVFIGAFARTTLLGEEQYVPLFENPSYGREWLPDNFYLSHLHKTKDVSLQDYEEDINLFQGVNGLANSGSKLAIWREEMLASRSKGTQTQENHALLIGWDYGENIPESDSMAYYDWEFENSLLLAVQPKAILLSLAAGDVGVLNASQGEKEKTTEEVPDPLFEITDGVGNQVNLRLSMVKPLTPRLKSRFMKLSEMSKDRVGKDWEVHLETYALPVQFFQGDENFNWQDIKKIRLLADKTNRGVLVIDNLGLRF